MDTAHDIGGLISGLVGLMGVSAVLGTMLVIKSFQRVSLFWGVFEVNQKPRDERGTCAR